MSVAIFLFLLANFGSDAFPLIHRRADITIAPPNPFILPTKRTLFNIIWTCLTTTFFCVWLAMHPNVFPNSSSWSLKGLKRRLRLVEIFWILVTPELVLAWALRQWFAAASVRRIYNTIREPDYDKAWSLHHGYFVVMGGFTLIEPSVANPGRGEVLSFKRFLELVQDPNVDFPPITVDEIRDRSKADELGHLIVVLQATWFLCQCLVRHLAELPLTQLELITLTLVICNTFTVMLWLCKPQDVHVPVKIRLPESATPPGPLPVSQTRYLTTKLADAFFGIIRAETVSPGASNVPTFYAPKTILGPYGRMFIFAAFGAVSGGLLYTGVKSSSFATMSEFKVWHHSSLMVSTIPILLLPFDFMIERRDRMNMPSMPDVDLSPRDLLVVRLAHLEPAFKITFLNMIFGSIFLLHVTIKIVLIAQAVALLRTQPDAVFVVADWTKYIPHFS